MHCAAAVHFERPIVSWVGLCSYVTKEFPRPSELLSTPIHPACAYLTMYSGQLYFCCTNCFPCFADFLLCRRNFIEKVHLHVSAKESSDCRSSVFQDSNYCSNTYFCWAVSKSFRIWYCFFSCPSNTASSAVKISKVDLVVFAVRLSVTISSLGPSYINCFSYHALISDTLFATNTEKKANRKNWSNDRVIPPTYEAALASFSFELFDVFFDSMNLSRHHPTLCKIRRFDGEKTSFTLVRRSD